MAFSNNRAWGEISPCKTHIKCTIFSELSSRFSVFIEHFKHLSFRAEDGLGQHLVAWQQYAALNFHAIVSRKQIAFEVLFGTSATLKNLPEPRNVCWSGLFDFHVVNVSTLDAFSPQRHETFN